MPYDREAAVRYAHRYAYARNPAYGAFDEIGGDCANFVSQCLYAGGFPMQPGPEGWYYRSMGDRAPAWTGVFFLKRFLLTHRGMGPRGAAAALERARPGDVIFLDFLGEGAFTHSALVVAAGAGQAMVAAHTVDSDFRPLDSYLYRAALLVAIGDS